MVGAKLFWSYIFIVTLIGYLESAERLIRGCYYTNWAQYRHGVGKYLPENYQSGLCTHIFYAFAEMNSSFDIRPFEWNDQSTDYNKGMYQRVNDLKRNQSDLKTLLSFGGWTYCEKNKAHLKLMASNFSNRHKFITSSLEYTKKFGFDGFDLDWEYPNEDDKDNFSQLLREMSSVFHSHGLLLTAAVPAAPTRIDAGYTVSVLAETLDFVNIMTYDIHGSWENVTGFNSPLYDRGNEKLSMKTAAEYWHAKGLPKNKIVVGFATYGRSWSLMNRGKFEVGALGGRAEAGKFTNEAGFLAYYEICDLIAQGAKKHFDPIQKVPFIVWDDQWVGFDDRESFQLKLDWLLQHNYGGAFVWTLDLDDFSGNCTGEKFYLIKTITDRLTGGTALESAKTTTSYYTYTTRQASLATRKSSATTAAMASSSMRPIFSILPTSSTIQRLMYSMATTAPTNEPMSQRAGGEAKQFSCPAAGLYPDPNSCYHFYSCHFTIEAHRMTCGGGLTFNPKTKTCDWPSNSQCPLKEQIL